MKIMTWRFLSPCLHLASRPLRQLYKLKTVSSCWIVVSRIVPALAMSTVVNSPKFSNGHDTFLQKEDSSVNKMKLRNEDMFFHDVIQRMDRMNSVNGTFHDSRSSTVLENLSFDSNTGWDELRNNLTMMSSDEVLESIFKIHSIHTNESTMFSSLQFETIKALVTTSAKHVDNLSLESSLNISSVWFRLGLNFQYPPVHVFLNEVLATVAKSSTPLSRPELVQMMFYIGVSRKEPRDILSKIEGDLLGMCDLLTLSELAVVCVGFFKTKATIDSIELLSMLANRLKTDCHGAENMEIAGILKCFSSSINRITARCNPGLTSHLLDALDALSLKFNKLSIKTIAHSMWCSVRSQQTTQQLLNSITQYLESTRLSEWRLKDLSRLIFILANFHSAQDNSDVFLTLTNELRRPERLKEIESHPNCLLTALIGLSIVEEFPGDLLEMVFSEEFQLSLSQLSLGKGKADFSRELIQLRESVILDSEQVCHPALYGEYSELLQPKVKRPRIHFGKHSEKDVLLKHLLEQIDPALSPSLSTILPYMQTLDIEVNVCGKQNTTSSVGNLLSSTLLKLQNKLCRVAVIALPPNCFYGYRDVDGSMRNMLMGVHVMRKRHLESKGYKVVQVTAEDLNNVNFDINRLIHSAADS